MCDKSFLKKLTQNGFSKESQNLTEEENEEIKKICEVLCVRAGVDHAIIENELFGTSIIHQRNKKQLSSLYLLSQMMNCNQYLLPLTVILSLKDLMIWVFTDLDHETIVAHMNKQGSTNWGSLARSIGRGKGCALYLLFRRYKALAAQEALKEFTREVESILMSWHADNEPTDLKNLAQQVGRQFVSSVDTKLKALASQEALFTNEEENTLLSC